MRPLLKINEPERFSSGIWIDTPENQPSLWRDATNVLFSDGLIEKSRGYSQTAVVPSRVSGMASAFAGGFQRLYIGAGSQVFMAEGLAPPTQIGSGFAPNSLWVLEPYGNFLLATNGVNRPQIWENTGALVPWPTAPFLNPRLVKKLEVFPILFQGQEIAWPAYNNFKDFVPGPGKRAGQFFVRDLDGDIMAAEPLGDALVYYSQDMFGFIRFVGGEAAMSIRTHPGGGIGAVGPHAVAACGPFHYGISRKGIWQSDGNSFRYVARPAVARWFKDQIDWLNAIDCVVVHHEAESQVVFFFPCKDGTIRGLGYTYDGPASGRWTKLEMPITAAAEQSTFTAPPVAAGTTVGLFATGSNAGTSVLPSSLRSAPLDMGSTDQAKRWQMLELHLQLGAALEFRVGYSNALKAEPEWIDWRSAQHENWLEDFESIFLTVEFRHSQLGTNWRLTGMEIHGEPVGKRR